MRPIPPQRNGGTLRALATSVALTVAVALALSLAFHVGRGALLLSGIRHAAERLGVLTLTRAESGTDLDGDGYTSTGTGGTDCYDSFQAQYSSGTVSCDSTANAVTFDARKPGNVDVLIADHTWMKDDNGLWHLFFQNSDSAEKIEHFTSTNLTGDLTYVDQPAGLLPGVGTWDEQIWAPYVIKNGSTYYLFYTGVTNTGNAANDVQRIGVATATSLNGPWTKVASTCNGVTGSGCVYDCNQAWTTWNRGTAYDAQCRDPFVLRDSANNRWVLFATTKFPANYASEDPPIASKESDGVTVASLANLSTQNWSGIGYLKATRRIIASEGGTGTQTTGAQAENPFVTSYNGTNYLFYTDWEDGALEPTYGSIVQYVTASSLTFTATGSSAWSYRGHYPIGGVNAMEIVQPYPDTWIGSASMSNGNDSNLGSPFVYRDLIWHRLTFGANYTLSAAKLTKLSCRVASNTIKPGGAEICSDNVDQNCSGTADEALYCAACADADGDGYGTQGLNNCSKTTPDCNDQKATANPGAQEICDTLDNNCDGQVNEGGVCTSCSENWGCGTWSACAKGTQTRNCTDVNTCGTTTSQPAVEQTCSEQVPAVCTEHWSCGDWSSCSRGFQTRACIDANLCGGVATQPATLKTCIVPAEQILISLPVSSRSPVQVFSPAGKRTAQFRPFTTPNGTASLAAGDVNADDAEDIIAGSGAGAPPRIRVFTKEGRRWHEFAPFPESVRTGVQVSVGDIDGDNQRDIVATPGPGALGRISTFRYDAGKKKFVRRSTFVPVPRWRDGFALVLDDLDGDTRADLVLLPRRTTAAVARVYRFVAASGRWVLDRKFRIAPAGTGQIIAHSLATGDVNGDGQREILIATTNGAPNVAVFNRTGKRVKQFAVGPRGAMYQVFVTAFDENGDGGDEVVVMPASGRTRTIRYYRFANNGKTVRLIRRVNIARQADQTKEFRSPR